MVIKCKCCKKVHKPINKIFLVTYETETGWSKSYVLINPKPIDFNSLPKMKEKLRSSMIEVFKIDEQGKWVNL